MPAPRFDLSHAAERVSTVFCGRKQVRYSLLLCLPLRLLRLKLR